MTSKLKTDVLETVSGSGTIALTNQLSGMTSASVPSGSVVQMVSSQLASNHVTSATSFADIISLSITPTSTTSKIIIEFTAVFYKNNTGNGNAGKSMWRLLRDNALVPAMSTDTQPYLLYTDGSVGYMANGILKMVDSPSSTSSVAYKFQSLTGGGALLVYRGATMTLTEIKG